MPKKDNSPAFLPLKPAFQATTLPNILLFLLILVFIAAYTISILINASIFKWMHCDGSGTMHKIWLMSQGMWPKTTLSYSQSPYGSPFSVHFQPVLFLLAGFYRLLPFFAAVIVLKISVIASGALATAWLARQWFSNRWTPLLFAAVYLFNPLTFGNVYREIYVESFGIAPVMFLLASVEARRYRFAAVFMVLSLLCAEYFSLILAVFGFICLIRQRKIGWLFILTGFIWFGFYYKFIATDLSGDMAEGWFKVYFGQYGSRFSDIVPMVFQMPEFFIGKIMRVGNIEYFRDILRPFGFLPLAGGVFLLPLLPLWFIYTISDTECYRWVDSHYQSYVIPFLIAAAMSGAARISGVWKKGGAAGKIALVMAVFLVLWNFNSAYYLAFKVKEALSLRGEYRAHRLRVEEALGLIPPAASVSAHGNLCGHLYHRKQIYAFPMPFIFKTHPVSDYSEFSRLEERIHSEAGPEYVVLDLFLKKTSPLLPADGLQAFEMMGRSRTYEKIFEKEGVAVFKRKNQAVQSS